MRERRVGRGAHRQRPVCIFQPMMASGLMRINARLPWLSSYRREPSPRSRYHFLLNADGQRPMSLRDQMRGIFSTASHREDADYSKHIPPDAKQAALMCYRDVVQGSQAVPLDTSLRIPAENG